MNPGNFKFTLYDIVSYTFCGAIALVLFYIAIKLDAITLPDTEFTKYLLKLISLESVISFIVVAYFLGKIISAISSLLIEKIVLGLIFNKLYKPDKIDKYISGDLNSFFNEKFSKLYNNSTYSEDKWRLITTYVEENRPASYATAFIFLSYYGMARNLMLIFLIISILSSGSNFTIGSISLLLFLVETYEYLRFKKHFHQRIIYAFLNNNEKANDK